MKNIWLRKNLNVKDGDIIKNILAGLEDQNLL